MNKLIIIPILIGIGIVISASALLMNDNMPEPESKSIYTSGFTYYDIEIIQNALSEHEISVSSPTAITDQTIDQYCLYFDKGLPRTVDYCTTTAVMDAAGNTLGNINLGGSIDSPILAIANLETSTLDSNQDQVFVVFETVIESLVCDCWQEEESIEFETISDWLETVQAFYVDSDERGVKSKVDNLADTEIFLEITPKENSVLRTLIILK